MRQSDVIRSAQGITARDAGIDEEAALHVAAIGREAVAGDRHVARR